MIDTHTHILPGVDDGVEDYEEALEALEAMEKAGISHVFATPHFSTWRSFMESYETYHERLETLREKATEAGIGVKLYIGSEIDESDELFEFIDQAPSLNGTPYILVDFMMRDADIEEIAYELKLYDYVLIIAHPERYPDVSLEAWEEVKAQGALLQVTAKHLIKKGQPQFNRLARKLLKEDLVDLVASDLHSPRHARTMKKAYDYVKRKKGKKVADALFYDNAKPIIDA